MNTAFTIPEMNISNPFKFFFRENNNNQHTQQQQNNDIISTIPKNFMEDGTDIVWEDTQEFTFPITGGRVIKVYDADTITIAAKLPYKDSPLYRIAVRLDGIDTPEMKGKDVSDDEKSAAMEARNFVYNLIFNKYVRLENVKTEKYGRLLADVYIKDEHLNFLLLKERYAVKYDGGTKLKPDSWILYKNTGKFYIKSTNM